MEAEPLLAMCDDIEPLACFTSTSLRSPSCDTDTDSPGAGSHDAEVQLTADVEAFLARLRREQVRFLDAISAARLELHSEPGQLAKAAALHARLAQRFLDAQRSILRGRAEADARIARIVEDGETADVLASMTNAALESGGAQAERQLRSLLDDWWRAERRGTVEPTTEAVVPVEPAVMLPGSLLAALETVDHTGLETLLVSLLDALGDPPTEHGFSSPTTGGVGSVASDPAPSAESARTLGEDAFDRFWGAGSARWTQRLARNWVVVHVLFPTVTVVAGLALMLAWTG